MIYTPLTRKALRIAFDAHKEQVDKTRLPYIFHPFHLAEQMETADEVTVAILHDVVEDSDTTLDDLRSQGFPAHVVDAVSLLTNDGSVDYAGYIDATKANPLAAKVMLADLRHNSDVTRLDVDFDARMEKLLAKYWKAIFVLTGEYEYCDVCPSCLRKNEMEADESDDFFGYHMREIRRCGLVLENGIPREIASLFVPRRTKAPTWCPLKIKLGAVI